MANKSKKKVSAQTNSKIPAQTQSSQPGIESKMRPTPEIIKKSYQGSGKLLNRVSLITGGDSGIGRATAVAFAREGSDVAIIYLNEEGDAKETAKLVENEGRKAILIKADISKNKMCKNAFTTFKKKFDRLDILVNNAAEQHPQKDFLDITEKDLESTFRTNIFSMFFLTQEALPLLKKSNAASIINTTSVTAYRGSPGLIDYSATKGAIVTFTRSLSQNLAEFNIRVNAVSPGPIWTPLIPATFDAKKVKKFGKDVPLGRPGQPSECAPAFVYLASEDSSYVTGQVLHVNGGEIING